MTPEENSARSRADCEVRTARMEKQMRRLWVPGRRARLLKQSYEIGHDAQQICAFDLAEKNFRRGIALAEGSQPQPTTDSRATFSIVAACHNQLGIQYLDEQRFTEAASAFDAAIAIRGELGRLFPTDRENEVYLGGILCNRGHASAQTSPEMARDFYEQSLALLRQPTQTCDCSYWDEARQSWWCEQVEVYGQLLHLPWIALAPVYIDNATEGLLAVQTSLRGDDNRAKE